MEPPDESPRDGKSINRTMEEWYQLPAEEDSSQLPSQDLSQQSDSYGQTVAGAWSLRPPAEQSQSLQLEFQDSRLSPALALLPAKRGNCQSFSDSMQQTDLEFVPLRGYPDYSVLSERLSMMPLVGGAAGFGSQAAPHSTTLDHASLSQHPLREDEESCCSLSQHSLPGRESDRDSGEDRVYERRGVGEEEEGEERSAPRGREEDDESFLSNSIPARTLLELLEKDVGVVSSSSAVSSASETVFSQPELVHKQTDITHNQSGSSQNRVDNPTMPGNQRNSALFQMGPSASSLIRSAESAIFQGSSSGGSTEEEPSRNPPGVRECPQGDASASPQPAPAPSARVDRHANRSSSQLFDTSNLSQANISGRPSRSADISNITFRSSGCRPDASTDVLRSQLLSESRAASGSPHAGSEERSPPDLSGGSSRLALQGAGGFSLERAHRDRVLWQSANQTGVDASFLTSQPAFQSTPSVASAASRTRVALLSGASMSYSPSPVLPADTLVPSRTRVSTTLSAGAAEIGTPRGSLTGSEVSSLPSLSYVQKVDAWRANQSSDRAFSNELELQGPTKDDQEADANANASATFESATRNHPFSQPREDSGAEGSAGVETGPTGGATGGGGGGGGGGGPAGVVSPPGRSHSHSSSLATVVTSIQHHAAAQSDDLTNGLQVPCAEEPVSREEVGPLGRAEQSNQNSQRSHIINLGHFSDVSSSRDTGHSLSSPQDSFHGEGSVRASFGGASSVVSLEVDNYAPYWTSIPSTPNRERELNIEDRIPVYLQNLGINQSPSTILNPFAPRGPIREPEFSPTDLCTIKGSTGTPTKSTQPSEGESPDKGEFSVLSQGSSCSLPLSAGRPIMPLSDQDRPPSQGSIRMSRSSSHTPPESPSLSATPLLPITPTHQIPTGSGQDSAPVPLLQPPQPREEAQATQLPQRSPRREPPQQQKQTEDWMVGSKTLQEIRQLLGRAESVLSLRSSLTTSTGSDSSLLQSLRRKMDEPSLASNTFGSSQLWARSSSDSMLKDSSASSSEPTRMLGATSQATTDLSVVPGIREAGLKSHAVRRAEPEGCSATDPDRVAPPTILPVTQAPALTSHEQEEDEDEEEAGSTPIGQEESSPAQSHVEVASMSDSSEVSDGSLSARVARLLQEESPVSMVTSRASTTDTDESRAREWILLKASGQKCEPLHLNTEDRQRIEEIKRELLQHTKSQYSTDSEGSAPSSVGGSSASVPTPSQRVEGFLAVRCAEERLSDQLRRAGRNLLESTGVALGSAPVRPDLEARVQEIALREGLPLGLGSTSTHTVSPLTSITIATTRRTPSPSPFPLHPLPRHQQQQQAENASVSTQTQTHTLLLQTHTPPASDTESDSSLSYADPHQDSVLTAHTLSQHTLSQHTHTHSDEPTVQETERQPVETSTVELGQFKSQVEEVTEAWGHQSTLAPRHSSTHLRLTLSPKLRLVQNGLEKPLSRMAPVDLHQDNTVRSALTGQTMSTDWTQRPLLEAQSLMQEDPIKMTNQEDLRDETPTLKLASTATSPVAEPHTPAPEPSVSSQTLSEEQGPIRSQLSTSGLVSVQISSSARYPQSFTPPQRLARPSPRPLSVYAPVPAPTLLPYKPHGSSELFYIPKTDSQLSPNRSDTTVESSHTGSDDAVPPRFNVDILGSRDQEPVPALPKHTEGIYSRKRASGSSVYERAAPVGKHGVGVSMTGRKREEEEEVGERGEEEEFRPLPMEMDFSMDSLRLHTSMFRDLPSAHTPADKHLNQPIMSPVLQMERTSQEIGGSLDQLWRRFSERWSQDQSQQASERETSLLERLERLSRLINSSSLTHDRSAITHSPANRAVYTQASTQTQTQMQTLTQDQSEQVRLEAKRAERGKSKKKGRKEKASGVEERKKGAREEKEGEKRGRAPRLAWAEPESQSSNHGPHEEEEEEVETDEPERLGRCPAERDSVSTETSLSTIDTQRLLRAFGPQRVRTLPATGGEKARGSLLKLYSNIHKQRSTANDSSTVTLDSSSSGSSHPPHPRVTSKRSKVKLVSRGVQAGDLEIVSNGTRRHTRDVGTTFPSPHPTSSGQPQHTPQPQQHSFLKERPKKKPTETHPDAPGVSWFVPAEELKHDSRKENRPDNGSAPAAGPTWFEPYSRTRPWREPLRERQNQDERVRESQRERENQEDRELPPRRQQQQQQSWVDRERPTSEEREKASEIINSTDLHGKLSALERLSLQEALAFRRPEFVSRSRERLKRLCLLKEERRLQSQFNLERETLFNHPPLTRRYTHNTAVPAPPVRRAVPKKEMFQRSKQIYSQLPEVRQRKEEEKRRAEYRGYRLNAQLFNKKVTNRVLGRRTPWQ